MRRTAALQTFATACILLIVSGVLYSANPNRRAGTSNGAGDGINWMAGDDDEAGLVQREARMKGWIAGVGGGLMATSLLLYRDPRRLAVLGH